MRDCAEHGTYCAEEPLLLEEMPLQSRTILFDDLLADLTAEEVRWYVCNPLELGLAAEAILAHMTPETLRPDMLRCDLPVLVELAQETLLARLPAIA